jgi:hypothetical protein
MVPAVEMPSSRKAIGKMQDIYKSDGRTVCLLYSGKVVFENFD